MADRRDPKKLPTVDPGASVEASGCGPSEPDTSGVPIERRQALKVMAIVAAAPGLVNCAPGGRAATSEIAMLPSPRSNHSMSVGPLAGGP